jgi:hypothetical protein
MRRAGQQLAELAPGIRAEPKVLGSISASTATPGRVTSAA